MNGPKVGFAALVKFGYMLETPSILWYSSRGNPATAIGTAGRTRGSDNPRGADNQQERLIDPDQNPQRLYAEHLVLQVKI